MLLFLPGAQDHISPLLTTRVKQWHKLGHSSLLLPWREKKDSHKPFPRPSPPQSAAPSHVTQITPTVHCHQGQWPAAQTCQSGWWHPSHKCPHYPQICPRCRIEREQKLGQLPPPNSSLRKVSAALISQLGWIAQGFVKLGFENVRGFTVLLVCLRNNMLSILARRWRKEDGRIQMYWMQMWGMV